MASMKVARVVHHALAEEEGARHVPLVEVAAVVHHDCLEGVVEVALHDHLAAGEEVGLLMVAEVERGYFWEVAVVLPAVLALL